MHAVAIRARLRPAMRDLVLCSNSTVHGGGYLEWCEEALREALAGRRRVLFVPWALHDHGAYAAVARARFADLGLELDSLHEAPEPRRAVEQAEAVFVGGGNTFRLLDRLQRAAVIEPLRARAAGGMPYLGSSAGTNVACASIRTTNDMPIVQPASFEALGLVPFNVNPHYVDPEPGSRHMGETREQRIREFHEENDPPVVGLREGTLLRVRGERVELHGALPARLFVKGREPREIAPGERLDPLLEEAASCRD